MGLCSANGARHNIFCEYFINRHLQSSWTKLDEGNSNLSWDSYSWQVTSCAQIHHFVSYFSFQFAQSYQMLAPIHYYAVTCYNYYLLRNKTEFNWVCCEELKTDWADMMNDVSYHVSPPTSIMAPSVKLSRTVHKIHIWLLLSLQYVIFTLRFSFSVSPVVQLVSPWAHGQPAWVILWSSDLRLTKLVRICPLGLNLDIAHMITMSLQLLDICHTRIFFLASEYFRAINSLVKTLDSSLLECHEWDRRRFESLKLD